MKNNTLVVYFSYSNGNTRHIAELAQKALGADLAEIKPVHPYTGTYNEVVEQGQREVERGFKPEIEPLSVTLSDYDTVAVGTPTWWYTMAPAVLTFLTANNWAGKTVIPFMTNGGWPGHVIKDMAGFVPGIRARQKQHAGSRRSDVVSQAIGHHRQSAHRMDWRFGSTDRLQQDLRRVFLEKAAGMEF